MAFCLPCSHFPLSKNVSSDILIPRTDAEPTVSTNLRAPDLAREPRLKRIVALLSPDDSYVECYSEDDVSMASSSAIERERAAQRVSHYIRAARQDAKGT